MSVAAERPPSVGIVGGGLAGMAAAAALSTTGFQVSLFEARRRWGGRATSFREPASGELVDFCQHVSMRCCTNLADLAQRCGIASEFSPSRVLHFIAPDGRQCDLSPSRWLPAPFHWGPALARISYLTAADKLGIARAFWRLMREPIPAGEQSPTAAEWLRAQRQSPRAIEHFWGVVLVSALGESLEGASMAAARQVFVEGFLANREASVLEVPTEPLGEIYGERMPRWLAEQGVQICDSSPVKQIARSAAGKLLLQLPNGETAEFDQIIAAVPWHQLPELLSTELHWPGLAPASAWRAAPITGVHLWFDRPITPLPHAVLVGRLGQWLFDRGDKNQNEATTDTSPREYYYQVVISALRDLAGRDREAVVAELCDELRPIWPQAAEARLLRLRVVTEQAAVFSVRPGIETLRPIQRTPINGLFLAGDWTATGWPATMEGAVRSGYLAAEEVTASLGQRRVFLVPDLPRSWLAKRLIR